MEVFRVRTVRAPAGKQGFYAVIKEDATGEVLMLSWGLTRLVAIEEARRRLRRVKGDQAKMRILVTDALREAEESGRARA